MNGVFLSGSKGTVAEEWNITEDVSGKSPTIYYPTDLKSATVLNKFPGSVNNTLYSLGNNENDISYIRNIPQQFDPVVKFLDKEQEGYTLTFQKWRGVVKEVSEEVFVANVANLTEDLPDEQVEFFRSDVSLEDRELLSIGAVFYWCVGHTISSGGQLMRTSFIRFQRLPSYTKQSIARINQKVASIKKFLNL